ncbi:MAG: SDR family oxidoreductase, partial [Calditrichota bacterium]
TSGIGYETAKSLAEMGASVVVIGRNKEKSIHTVEQLTQLTGNEGIEHLLADLSSQEEIRNLAKKIQERYDHLDVLVNNAGAIFFRRQETKDGLEMTFALNHLGYFLLTNLLLNLIEQSAPARIVNVASASHRGASINFDDLQSEQSYSAMKAYGQSKLANILFTYELARRLENSQVKVNALHPGFVGSNFGKNSGWLGKAIMPFLHLFARSPEKGAETAVYLAASPEVDGITGQYFIDKKPADSSPASHNVKTAQKLWEVSEQLTGLRS